MKALCECNSSWEIAGEYDYGSSYIPSQVIPYDYGKACDKCKFYKWVNPSEENQMRDLKSMNE